MGTERALILDLVTIPSVSVPLRQILETDFTVTILPQLKQTHPNWGLDAPLEQLVRQYEPSIIFFVAPASNLDTAKDFLSAFDRAATEIPVIAVVEPCAPEQAFELLRFGAKDFIISPFEAADVLPRAWRLLDQIPSEPKVIKRTNYHIKQLIGESQIFLDEVKKIPLIGSCDANVLLIGETGTGKELYARAIHYGSVRAGKPFIPVNCGSIPSELVENELFGHTRGAYTGASSLQVGLIEEANGGTIFLDEIDCLPIFAQVKLLRFLQEKEYRPLGSPKMRHADVRVIAASNVNLPDAVDDGRLRQDLFYRLNIISLTLPPLRERSDDIPLLARHFLTKYSRESQKRVSDFSDEALHLLIMHNWPGNVRELEHVIERAVVLCEAEIINLEDVLLTNIKRARRESLKEAKAKEIARFERNYIQGVLSLCRGNITKAAQVAQKNRRAFWQLIQKHQIDVTRFKSA